MTQNWCWADDYKILVTQPCPDSLQPPGLQPARLPCPWDFPAKNTAEGGHSLLQGVFLTQGSNLGLQEKAMATHSSILAWKILWTEELGGLQSRGSQRIRHDWACTHATSGKHPLWTYTRYHIIQKEIILCSLKNILRNMQYILLVNNTFLFNFIYCT